MDENYFINTRTSILENSNLRDPQIEAYAEVYNHFIVQDKKTHAIVVLPTGTGKTGLISILPYNIAKGRVLIITPQLTILDTIEKNLNSDDNGNFWSREHVIDNPSELPILIKYEGSDTSTKTLNDSQIVVANIQKLQSTNSNSLMSRCDPDFFDMIIVDEAHHAEAQTWVDNLNYFTKAKVVKLTATAFRTDKKSLVGELVYKYKLSQAMSKGYVKSIEKFDFLPDELYFTIDNDHSRKYTFEEILDLDLKDEEWISRSVVFSKECKISIVKESIKLLNSKRRGSRVPHKIIAAASNIQDAEEIAQLYTDNGLRSVAIHNDLSDSKKKTLFSDIENNRVDVVVNVSMMGEGYDHKYFSVAAIFRAFKNALPYEQFIGRVLRVIPDSEVSKDTDNIADVVAHKLLFLDKLWNYYKNQLQESNFIAEIPELIGGIDENESGSKIIHHDFGYVNQSKSGNLEKAVYLETDIIKKAEQERKERKEKIRKIVDILNVSEKEAGNIIDQQESSDSKLKRPDLFLKISKKTTDSTIREVIVPELLTISGNSGQEKNLFDLPIFNNKSKSWLVRKAKNDAALLAIYFNDYLKSQIGHRRADWSAEDFNRAAKLLEQQKEYLSKILKDEFEK